MQRAPASRAARAAVTARPRYRRRMTKLIACVLVLAVAATACKKEQAPPSAPEPPPTSQFDERQACTADADCEVVEIECCDHCNGGTVVGVHRDHVADVRQTYVPADKCEGVACTKMACAEGPIAFCKDGACATRTGDREDAVPLPAP
jgi:hypothetical protein